MGLYYKFEENKVAFSVKISVNMKLFFVVLLSVAAIVSSFECNGKKGFQNDPDDCGLGYNCHDLGMHRLPWCGKAGKAFDATPHATDKHASFCVEATPEVCGDRAIPEPEVALN